MEHARGAGGGDEELRGALLGDENNGRWRIAPEGKVIATSREYLDGTFVLVTHWETEHGKVDVTDFMPIGDRRADIVIYSRLPA